MGDPQNLCHDMTLACHKCHCCLMYDLNGAPLLVSSNLKPEV